MPHPSPIPDFGAFSRHAPVVFCLHDPREPRHIVRLTDNCATVIGHEAHAFNANPGLWAELIHPADLAEVLAGLAAISDQPRQLVYRLKQPDGALRRVEHRLVGLFDDAGELQSVQGFLRDVTADQDRQTMLRKNERFLLDAQESAHIGCYATDLKTGEWECTPVMDRIFGISADYPHNIDGWTAFMHPDFGPSMNDYLITCIQNKQPFDAEYKMVRPSDGAERWMHGLGKVFYDDEGAPVWLLGTVQDITERKQAEADIQELGQRFQAVIDTTKDGFYLADQDGHLLEVNDVYCQCSGYSRNELLTMRIPQLDYRQHRGEVERRIAKMTRVGGLIFQTRHRRKDGSLWDVEISASYSPIQGGRVFSFLRDISGQKRTEAELGRYRQQLEQMVEERTAELQHVHRQLLDTHFAMNQVGIGIHWVDAETGRLLYVNEHAARMLGYQPRELLNMSIPDIDPDFPSGDFKTICERLFATGSAVFESRERRKDGTLIPVEIVGYLGPAEEGQRSRFITFVSDITERNKVRDALLNAKAAAEQATQSKSDFLANMSHEIRTPMNAVLGLAYLLTRQKLPEEALSLARKIQSSGQSLLSIINDILDLSKIESGKIELEHAPFQLSQVLDNLATIMTGNARDKALDLLIIPPTCSEWTLNGDSLHLGQVLINLTNNAIKFTDAGWVKVRISVIDSSRTEVRLRFSVHDTGIGIDSATQARLFQPFVQADASTQRRFGGSGLGLVIARRLVELMGGAMGLDSTPGQGSTFWFDLPFTVIANNARTSPPMQVLIVADQPQLGSGLRETVAALCWPASIARNQEGTLRQLLRSPALHGPDAAVLLALDDADGLATASAIRAALPAEQWPLLLMLSSHHIGEHQAPEGIDALLTKPLTPSPLYDTIMLARQRRLGSATPSTVAPPHDQRLRGLHLLVVDDNETNREVARGIFTEEGAEVSLARDGQDALDWLTAHASAVSAVLMDVQMPVMDGLDATRAIRERPEMAKLPVVALTAGAMPAQQRAAREAGVDGFLPKPFDIEQAVALIASLTGRAIQRPAAAAVTEIHADSNDQDYPGINLQQALGIWKDASRYRQFLRKFAAKQADTVQRIRAGEPDVGRRLAHGIKGSAGNLGLDQVAARAGDLERLFLAKAGAEPITAATAALQSALETALESIARYAGQAPTPDAQPSPTDLERPGPARIAELMQTTHQAFADFEPTLAEAPLTELAAALPADQLAPLRAAIENLDASAGLAAARALAGQLGIALDGGSA